MENSFQMCTILEIKRGMSSWPIYWRLGVHGLMPAVDIVSVISFTLALCHVRSGTLTEAYGFSIYLKGSFVSEVFSTVETLSGGAEQSAVFWTHTLIRKRFSFWFIFFFDF